MIYELFLLIILKPQILNVFTKLLERVRIQPEGFKYSVLSKKEIEVTEDKTLECVKSLVLVVLFVLLSLSTKSGNFFLHLKRKLFYLVRLLSLKWSVMSWCRGLSEAWGTPDSLLAAMDRVCSWSGHRRMVIVTSKRRANYICNSPSRPLKARG